MYPASFTLDFALSVLQSIQQGVDTPPFSDYQDVLGSELPIHLFASYVRPTNIPPPATLVRMARAIYPHWRSRKLEREGHRIIPALNVRVPFCDDPIVADDVRCSLTSQTQRMNLTSVSVVER